MRTSTPRVRLGRSTQKYREYKKRVAHANAGGAIQREVVSIAELIPSHVQRAFTRVYHESRTITPMRLVDAVRAMLGMVRAQRWSYLQRPRPWREFHHCFGAGGGAGGAVSGSAGRASMARNRQVPRRSGNAIGVASEVTLRETAWRHSQWHQVGSRGNLLQRASSALRTRATTGVIVVLEGGDLPRVADLRGPLLLSSSTRRIISGPPDRGRVERLHNGLCRVPPLLRRRWRRQQQRRAQCLPLHRG